MNHSDSNKFGLNPAENLAFTASHRDYITCRELIGFIAEYLDESLAPDARREFDKHLEICSACVSYLESYRHTIVLGKAAFNRPSDLVPPSILSDLVQAILAARLQQAKSNAQINSPAHAKPGEAV